MPEFSDGIVTLAFFAPTDAPVLLEADADREHRRWFEFPGDFVPSLRHSESVIRRWEEERAAGTRFAFAVRSAADHDLLGGCELRPLGDGTANLSYWTYPGHRRRGVASRAVKLACEVASAEFDFHIVQVIVDPENIASRRVAVRNAFKDMGERDGKILYLLELAPAAPEPERREGRGNG
jgi:RimJ/RimL family protein N-acetyltransferase